MNIHYNSNIDLMPCDILFVCVLQFFWSSVYVCISWCFTTIKLFCCKYVLDNYTNTIYLSSQIAALSFCCFSSIIICSMMDKFLRFSGILAFSRFDHDEVEIYIFAIQYRIAVSTTIKKLSNLQQQHSQYTTVAILHVVNNALACGIAAYAPSSSIKWINLLLYGRYL